MFASSALVLGLGAVAIGSAVVANADQGNQISGFRGDHSVEHQAVHDALEAGDYNAWKEAVKGRQNVENFTEDQFNKLREMYQLRQDGKFDEANKIREELGLPDRQGHKGGEGHDCANRQKNGNSNDSDNNQ